MKRLYFPDVVYHGTFLSNLENFRSKPLDRRKWLTKNRDGRIQTKDFGYGLYTATDFHRVARFVQGKLKRNFRSLDDKPCILEFQVNHSSCEHFAVFTGVSEKWSEFVFDHRTNWMEPCNSCAPEHPELVVGPIADNSFRKVLASLKRKTASLCEEKGELSFEDFAGLKSWLLSSSELNNQIVFCNDEVQILRIVKYYTLDDGKWVEHNE